jgi:hypothetical protein
VALLSAPVSRAPLQRGPAQGAGGSGRPTGRLHCDARGRVAPQNSLRAQGALRSDSCGESVLDARCARRPCRCASRRSQRHPGQSPAAAAGTGSRNLLVIRSLPGRRRALQGMIERLTIASRPAPNGVVLASGFLQPSRAGVSADGGGMGRACGSPRSAGCEARARSALRPHARGSCPSVANAVSEASSAAGPCARAPQGSRPCGPTDTPKRRSPPPSAECGTAYERRLATALANRNPSSTH